MKTPRKKYRFIPFVEALEDRYVPYALSGFQWANQDITASIMPDGTQVNGAPSNLVAVLDQAYGPTLWRQEFSRALQTWSTVTPLNFHWVSDNGEPSGAAGLVQGDSQFGDIRLGGYAFPSGGLAATYDPFPSTMGGDMFVNTNVGWSPTAGTDLYSTFLHEVGHALGLEHSSVPGSVVKSPNGTRVEKAHFSRRKAVAKVSPFERGPSVRHNSGLSRISTKKIHFLFDNGKYPYKV